LTGIFDSEYLNGSFDDVSLPHILSNLREIAVQVNEEWAEKLNINKSSAVTCVKPSGTVSQAVDSASGIHPRHSKFYVRRVRGDNKDPMTRFLKEQGVPWEPCVMKPDTTTVFAFPMRAPEGALVREDVSAIQHLNLWHAYNKHWAEHQVSVTVSVKEDEWLSVAAWVYKNFDEITGISFLPWDNGSYQQAPYTTITEQEYDELLSRMPKELDWSKMREYEREDTTTGARELACVAGYCEI
jgi:ribonucleoside-diphosphate reductase alpha chain